MTTVTQINTIVKEWIKNLVAYLENHDLSAYSNYVDSVINQIKKSEHRYVWLSEFDNLNKELLCDKISEMKREEFISYLLSYEYSYNPNK